MKQLTCLTRASALLVALLALATAEVQGVIKTEAPLKLFVRDGTQIVQVRVGQFFPEKSAMVFEIEQDIKGKTEQRSFPVVWKVNPKAKDGNYLPPLLKGFGPGQQAILFINDGGKFWHNAQRKHAVSYGFVNGSWFFMVGQKKDDGKMIWILEQGEPYLRTTFKGTTAELNKTLTDHLAGKGALPDPMKTEPGFGPEHEPKK